MNNKKLRQTHKHLTLVFTGVVFVIVMTVGMSFLMANYISENSNQKKDIYAQVDIISAGMEENESFFTQYARQRIIEEVKKFRPWDIRGEKWSATKLSFIVLDDSNNLIFKEILQEPQFDEINFDSKKIYRDGHTYIFTKNIGDKKVIFYQNARYGFDDVWEDLLLLLFLAALLSSAVYFIGYVFVERALLPVEENIQDMTNFVHNAGHELKTPLAVMRGNLQIMQAEEKYDKQLLKKWLREIDNTNALLEGLIELSQIGKLSEKSTLALTIEVRKVVSELEGFANEKDIQIYNEVKGAFMLQANIQELHILLMNLVKNAIKYNKKWGEVRLTLNKNILTISDTGTGIADSEKNKIFERFYQWNTVRSNDGFGIGLSLVKKIADTNNWKISIMSKLWEGTSFEIIF